MRLRSSKFVFFLLLACSLQVGEGYAFRLIAEHVLQAAPLAASLMTSQTRSAKTNPAAEPPSAALGLSPQATVAQRTAWPMLHPASASTAVVSHTGLLRA